MDTGKEETLRPEQRLIQELADPEYRRAFVEGHATDTIAFQLRAMRNARGWDQRDVAEKLGNRKLQPMISRYENPDYGKFSVSTLLELAAAFDVALAVRFVPFSELAEWDLSVDTAKECPASFADDAGLARVAEGTTSLPGMFSGAAAATQILDQGAISSREGLAQLDQAESQTAEAAGAGVAA